MASAVIGALRVNLGIDTAQFNESLKGVRASLDKVGKNFQQWGGKLSTYVTTPIAAAGTAVTAAVTMMAKDIEQLEKAAQISNVGFEQFQKLAFAARSVGIESDKLSDIYKDVNDRVGDFMATGGGPMADFFENIAPKVGITAEAFRNLSGPQALQLYYDSLVKAGASQQDLTFYLEAMASDTTALIPLLQAGGKAFDELGDKASVISEEDAAGLKAYNDAMRGMGEAIKGLTIALAGSGILETLTSLVQKATEWTTALAKTNPEIVKWTAIIAGLAAAIGPVLVALGLMLTAVTLISAPVLAAVAAVAAVTAGLYLLNEGIKMAMPFIQQLAGDVWARITAGVESAKQAFIGFKERVVAIGAEIVAAFQAIPGQMMQIGSDIINGLWQGIQSKWDGLKGSVTGLASSIKGWFTGPLQIKSPSKVMAGVGVNVMEGLGQGMESMSGGVQSIGESIAQTVASSFQGLIDGSKKVSDVLKDLLSQVTSMLMDKAFQSLFGAMFGGKGSSGSGILSGIGKLFGFARGGTIMPGGAGGIDSQLVAFRKSPNERVDITKPGQSLTRGEGQGGGVLQVSLSPDLEARILEQAGSQSIQITRESNLAMANFRQNGGNT